MPLNVIGAGFGRTGTMSLKIALEQLGFGPCYHMVEVFHANAFRDWTKAARGEPVDWDSIFRGFPSAVDFPVSAFYRGLAQRYPQAKLILTERGPQSWYESAISTIFNPATHARIAEMPDAREMMATLFGRVLGVPMDDRDGVIRAYLKHNEDVKRTIPRDRLLVYSVAEGWAPLCRFLGVPVPATPFPKLNTRDDFGKMAVELTSGAAHGH